MPQEQRHAFAEQPLGGQLGMRLADVGAQRQIGLAREHLRHHLRGIAVVQRGHQLRVRRRKAGEQRRQQGTGREVTHGHHHAAFLQLRLRAAGVH